MNVHGIRRNMKNVVRNYSDAQVKVREATSNDPWGPPSTLMGEIADLSYNVVAFTEIMQMIWKRLNDHGKNWRHVYKALVLLEYLIKTGSEKVSQQCKENIFAIQTLKDFQHTEENKDQGVNVREKAKQLVSLLKDDERLRSERARALKAKERFAQATARVGSETLAKYGGGGRRDSYGSDTASPREGGGPLSSELESARPQTAGEEELQLQLALAMSKEEAEQEERVRKNDDLRLQIAISESQHVQNGGTAAATSPRKPQTLSGLDDLIGLDLGGGATGGGGVPATDPWGVPLYDGSQAAAPAADPWTSPTNARPPPAVSDPWSPSSHPAMGDPWAAGVRDPAWKPPLGHPVLPGTTNGGGGVDEFDMLSKRSAATSPIGAAEASDEGSDAFGMGDLQGTLPAVSSSEDARRKTPESFLGPNSNLVNLDALVTQRPPAVGIPPASNPFAGTVNTVMAPPPAGNPFQASKPPPPTINQLRSQNMQFVPMGVPPPQGPFVAPLAPQQNPFM
ncbi:epsin-2-like isoform X3 [Ornithodoros turicata]|uniref:epsin-2-like isoform X3 n=1 Tax=Ornithodoros turicata TaxID=34597 RepID=UPI00313880E7